MEAKILTNLVKGIQSHLAENQLNSTDIKHNRNFSTLSRLREMLLLMVLESETTQWQCESNYLEKLLLPEHRGYSKLIFKEPQICFKVKFMVKKLILCTKMHVNHPSSMSCII